MRARIDQRTCHFLMRVWLLRLRTVRLDKMRAWRGWLEVQNKTRHADAKFTDILEQVSI